MYQSQTRPKCTILSQNFFWKTWPMSFTKNSGSAPGAAIKILQRGRKVTKHCTDHSSVETRLKCWHSLERMSLASLLQRGENTPIDSVADGDGECDEGQVRHDAEHGEERQWQQQHQRTAKHHARLLGITPVYQIQHYLTHAHVLRQYVNTFN